ncbi:hypothetical protein SAMN04487771_10324 [[Clostridium] aminophilum]|uniref:Uncharacterized protein n=1 Tax=[Clostridium] aminophilum TaxID=1526 RepID=A0A1I0GAD4_9FIRM|nr:hypothetical protein SAMN04487771_10324 [[Clostridium] aminophilum]
MKHISKYLGFFVFWITELTVIALFCLRLFVSALEPYKNMLYAGAILILVIQICQYFFENKFSVLNVEKVKTEKPALYKAYENSFKLLFLLLFLVSIMTIQVSNS